jgi:hypothetical protein
MNTFVMAKAKDIYDISVKLFNFEKSSTYTGVFGMDVSGRLALNCQKRMEFDVKE